MTNRASSMASSVLNAGTPEAVIQFSSVSQVQSFELCARRWYYDKIKGVPQPTSPRQVVGIEGHAQIENYLTTGTDALGRFARAGKHFLPDPNSPDVLIEHPIYVGEELPGEPDHFNLTADDVPFRGFIDLFNQGEFWRDDDGRDRELAGINAVEVVDWKFIGDLKWAKSADDLRKSTQMIGYAEWARRNYDVEYVRLSHGSFQTQGGAKALKTSTLIKVSDVREAWQSVDLTVSKMKVAARAPQADDVEPTYSACGAYGGCAYRDICPRTPGATIKQLFGVRRDRGDEMSLLDKYRKKPAEVPADVAAEVEKLKAEESRARGVLPPDAPKSEPPKSALAVPADATVNAEIREAAKAWVEKQEVKPGIPTAAEKTAMTEMSAATPPATVTAPAEKPKRGAKKKTETTAVSTELPSFGLFVDVVLSGVEAMSLEPYITDLCKKLAEASGVDDIRCATEGLLSFSKWKGALAAAVREAPPTPGIYVLMDVRESELRQVVVEALRPIVDFCVRAR